MKIRLNDNVAILFKQEIYIEVRKGIWNRETITIEIEENDKNSSNIMKIFENLRRGE